MEPRTECEHCFGTFEVEKSMRGALVNCPECGKATRAAGDGDPLWTGLQVGVGLVAVTATILVGANLGLGAGLATGGALGLLLWLLVAQVAL